MTLTWFNNSVFHAKVNFIKLKNVLLFILFLILLELFKSMSLKIKNREPSLIENKRLNLNEIIFT